MLVSVQIISRVLATQDYSIIEDNLLDESYFEGYENEYNFIKDFYVQYHKVPDEISFMDKFPDFDLVEVTDSNRYLVDTIREKHLYIKFTKVLPKVAELLKQDSEEARDFLEQALKADLKPVYSIYDEEIVENIDKRVEASEYVNQNVASKFIPTGFDEIDDDIVGLQRGDELTTIVARINMGKSWVLEAIITHAVEQGYRAGCFSPEMSVAQLGYRFDTLHGNVPNSTVFFGKFDDEYTLDDYKQYAEELKSETTGKLYVTKPKDFNRKLTVSKLRTWIKARNLDIVAIDGITYLSDERYKKGDSRAVSLTNISEDLMDLSSELGVPIIVVVQANRGGVVEKGSLDTPELENIKDSDGIGANSSTVFAVRQLKDNEGNIILIIQTKKSRTGEVGKQYKYCWDINRGKFEYQEEVDISSPDDEDSDRPKRKSSKSGATKKSPNMEEVF